VDDGGRDVRILLTGALAHGYDSCGKEMLMNGNSGVPRRRKDRVAEI